MEKVPFVRPMETGERGRKDLIEVYFTTHFLFNAIVIAVALISFSFSFRSRLFSLLYSKYGSDKKKKKKYARVKLRWLILYTTVV